MNDNERRFKINWADIVSKIIFLIIFVLILMWFFPNNNVNSDNNINNKDKSVLEKYNFGVLFDKIFKDNLNEMKYAAKSYFTKERMPAAGEEKTLTLQEMYDMNLLLPLIDKNDKACSSEKSLVKVTKEGQEYRMKITLSCGEETKTITEVIGCYDFCEDGSCKGQIATKLQYQFLREVERTTYSCPKGYTLKGKYCYTSEFGGRIEATEIISKDKVTYEDAKKNTGSHKVYTDITKVEGNPTYSCPEGYKLNGTKCEKIEYSEPTTESGYSCPEGYEKNGNYCYKSNVTSATPNYSYTCPSGYTLNGTKCSKVIKTNPTTIISGYTCPSNCTPEANKNTCLTQTTKAANSSTKVTGYTCPSGYSLSGTTCSKKVANGTSYGSWYSTGSVATYDSYRGAYLSTSSTSRWAYTGKTRVKGCNNTCYVTKYQYVLQRRSATTNYKTVTTAATKLTTTTYTCSGIGGTLSGKNCIISTRKSCVPKYKITCTTGTLVENVCEQTNTIDATKKIDKYSCPAGYTLDGTICKNVEVIPGTPTEGEKTCPEGYTKEGDACQKTTTKPAEEVPGKVTYSCPEGYINEENKSCYKNETTEGDYYCENEKAELVGNKCKITTPGGKVTGYKCPNGYTKNAKYCYKYVSKKINATSKTVLTYEYKWSYLKTLPGWTRTGKTRSA